MPEPPVPSNQSKVFKKDHSRLCMLKPNKIYQMDAIEGLKQLSEDSVDLVITDPPYNITAPDRMTMRRGKPVSTIDVMGTWDCYHPFDYDLMIMQVISHCYRILKPGAALYMFTANEHNGFFIRQAVNRGFIYRNQLAMVKKNPLPSLSKSNFRHAFEVCMYVSKGKPKTFNFLSQQICKNVLHYSNTHRHTTHPTEKPLAFIKQLVEVSSRRGDLVVDPFMGSGTTAVASRQLGRNFIGFELEPDYIQMANERLKGGSRNPKRITRSPAESVT